MDYGEVIFVPGQNLLRPAETEFKEFKPRRWTAKNRFQLSAGLNLKTLNTISCGTNHVRASSQFFKFVLFKERNLLQIISINMSNKK